jgi:mRNA interferase RelE/StbE
MYRRIDFYPHVEKFNKKILKQNPAVAKAMALEIQKLVNNPLPKGYKKLVGRDYYRIRVQNYRIIYEYNDEAVSIILIDHRKQVYNISL